MRRTGNKSGSDCRLFTRYWFNLVFLVVLLLEYTVIATVVSSS